MIHRVDQTIDALRSAHDHLAALVRGFSDDDLTRPSGAPGWDMSQILGHLGCDAEFGVAALDGALNGTGAPGEDFNKAVLARWDTLSPAERAEGFMIHGEALVSRTEELDATTRRELGISLGYLPEPVNVATAASMRLSELAHHAWDIEVADDPAAILSPAPAALELLLDQAAMVIGFLGKAVAVGDGHVTLAIRLANPERSFGLALGDTVTLLDDEPVQPDAILTAPAEWWLRFTTGRHSPQHTPDTVTLTGDALSLDDLRRVFPGF